MRRVTAKIGTHSQTIIFIGFKQKPPRTGDVVRFKEGCDPLDWRFPAPGVRWRQGKIEEIRDTGGDLLYCLSRW